MSLDRAYGLNDVDYHQIRETSEESIGTLSKVMKPCLNERALEIHFQRIVGAYVAAAHGAGSFYDAKAQAARDLSSSLHNEDRDETRPGVDGTDSRAERARTFAATTAIQAYAALAAAEGAISAYAEIIGSDWKPYVGNTAASQSLNTRAIAEQMAAFDR